MLVHGMMVLRDLIYTISNKHGIGYYGIYAWEYGKTTVCDMVCVGGMGREKHSIYMAMYVCGMVPWYDVVDVLYGQICLVV